MQDIFDLFCELVSNLKNRDVRLRREAIAAIGVVADSSCTNIILDAIRTETDLQVRASLIKTLGNIGTINLVPVLAQYLKDPDARCRSNTVEALSRFTEARSQVIELIGPLVNDPSNRVVGTTIRVLHDLGDRSGLEHLVAMLRGDDNARRCRAIWAVGELKYEPELPALLHYTGSPNCRVHSVTIQVIRKFGTAAVPHLLSALPRADRFRKAYLARALGEIGDARALEPIRGLLGSGDDMVTLHALTALGRLGLAEAAVDGARFLSSPSPEIRVEALMALRRIGVASVCPDVEKAMSAETDPRVLSAADSWLGTLGTWDAVPGLRRLTRHPDPRVRANAIESLGLIGDRRIVEELRPFLDDANGRVFANAAIALYEFGDLRVVDLLKEKLLSGTEGIRMSVAYALGEIPLAGVVEPLIKAVTDRSERVRGRVLASLLKKGVAAQMALQAAIQADSSLLDRPGAPTAAARLGIRSILEPLLGRLTRQQRAAGSTGASEADGRTDISSLFVRLRDTIDRSQLRLPEKLRSKPPEVVDGLRELLSSDDPALKCFALYTLGELASRETVGTMLCLLHDPDQAVRAYAVDALAKIKDRRALGFVSPMVRDPDSLVRHRAVRALGAFGDRESLEVLRSARAAAGPDFAAEIDRATVEIEARTSVDNDRSPS
ncbi:MAG: HEAT repeat domain-containing protein [Candidatus Riflebacteria bacterium]|nr:HEAT repeat domain-containing protein [Candidatus Riflebacteria bacterium]